MRVSVPQHFIGGMMNFTESISAGLSQGTEFDGRASREEYWYWNLFVAVVVGVLYLFGLVAGASLFLASIGAFALLLPSAAALVRRLHDIGRSGRWALLVLVPGIGTAVVLALALRKGDARQNAYGI